MTRKAITPQEMLCRGALTLWLSTQAPHALGGQLADFDKAATGSSNQKNNGDDKKHQHNERDHHHDDDEKSGDDFTSDLISGVVQGLFSAAISGNDDGSYRGQDNSSAAFPTHSPGDPTLPYFRGDVNYQYINSRISAVDGRVELGNAMVGLQIRQTHFVETRPDDALTITQVHPLLRMATHDRTLEADIGIGAIVIDGGQTSTGLSATLPIVLRPNDTFSIRLRPTWSAINDNTLRDYDASIELTPGYIAIQLGYRYQKVSTETLSGPYAGVSLIY